MVRLKSRLTFRVVLRVYSHRKTFYSEIFFRLGLFRAYIDGKATAKDMKWSSNDNHTSLRDNFEHAFSLETFGFITLRPMTSYLHLKQVIFGNSSSLGTKREKGINFGTR